MSEAVNTFGNHENEFNNIHDVPPPNGRLHYQVITDDERALLARHSSVEDTESRTIKVLESNLKEYLHVYDESKGARLRILTPIGILITLMVTFISTEFPDSTYFPQSLRIGIFLALTMVCIAWTIREIVLINKNKEYATVDKIIEAIEAKHAKHTKQQSDN